MAVRMSSNKTRSSKRSRSSWLVFAILKGGSEMYRCKGPIRIQHCFKNEVPALSVPAIVRINLLSALLLQ